MRFDLVTEIDIDAPPEAVWRHLADTSAWPEWNPMTRLTLAPFPHSGALRAGAVGILRLQLAPGAWAPVPVTVRDCEPNRELSWSGGVPGVAHGWHYFRLSGRGGGTRLVHGEVFSGVALTPMRWYLDTQARKLYERLNLKLKERAEG